MNHNYLGRFAPSPTGPLHFGSLLAALASYLDARHCGGKWFVRIEDLDPPREVPGASDLILKQLEQHGMHWDLAVSYQSQRQQYYRDAFEQLKLQDLIYACDCSRQQVRQMGGIYNNHCRTLDVATDKPVSWRINSSCYPQIELDDGIQGLHNWKLDDFIVRRRDNLFAYQLACAVDDALQGVSHIIRGSDLLDSTPRQVLVMKLLGYQPPNYSHIPVAVSGNGQKLSKQNHAPELAASKAGENLYSALQFLGQKPPRTLAGDSVENILAWAVANWRINYVPRQMAIEYHQVIA